MGLSEFALSKKVGIFLMSIFLIGMVSALDCTGTYIGGGGMGTICGTNCADGACNCYWQCTGGPCGLAGVYYMCQGTPSCSSNGACTIVVADTIYPTFSNYWDNNGTINLSGIGLFNVTLLNTNGSVLLEINNTNITATNLTANVYNASAIFTLNGTYQYRWHSWGNGTSHNYNVSVIRYYYVNKNSSIVLSDLAPANATNYSGIGGITINFTLNASAGQNLTNATLNVYYENGTLYKTNQTTLEDRDENIFLTIWTDIIGVFDWIWNIVVKDVDNNQVVSSNLTYTTNITEQEELSSLVWFAKNITSNETIFAVYANGDYYFKGNKTEVLY